MKSIKIGEKDKRMLIVLVLFFAVLGYYYLILSPLRELNEKTARDLNAKKAALELRRVEIMQIKSWQESQERLVGRIGSIFKMANAPPLESPVPERIEAIMKAAGQSGVTVENLRPVSSAYPEGTDKKTVNRFIVDGSCTFDSLMQFIRALYGMKTEQFSLSERRDSKGNLKFSLVLESQPRNKSFLTPAELGRAKCRDYKISDSLFAFKGIHFDKSRTEKKPNTPEDLLKKAEAALAAKLSGLTLEGIIRIENVEMAVISDTDDEKAVFHCYRAGDKVRGVKLVFIGQDEIRLESEEQISCTMRFRADSGGQG